MAHSALNYDPTRRYDFKVEDVEYRRDSDQSWLAMVYQPQGNGPFPALLDIHGGAWNSGDRTNNPAIAEGLAASGVVVGAFLDRLTMPREASLTQTARHAGESFTRENCGRRRRANDGFTLSVTSRELQGSFWSVLPNSVHQNRRVYPRELARSTHF